MKIELTIVPESLEELRAIKRTVDRFKDTAHLDRIKASWNENEAWPGPHGWFLSASWQASLNVIAEVGARMIDGQ